MWCRSIYHKCIIEKSKYQSSSWMAYYDFWFCLHVISGRTILHQTSTCLSHLQHLGLNYRASKNFLHSLRPKSECKTHAQVSIREFHSFCLLGSIYHAFWQKACAICSLWEIFLFILSARCWFLGWWGRASSEFISQFYFVINCS